MCECVYVCLNDKEWNGSLRMGVQDVLSESKTRQRSRQAQTSTNSPNHGQRRRRRFYQQAVLGLLHFLLLVSRPKGHTVDLLAGEAIALRVLPHKSGEAHQDCLAHCLCGQWCCRRRFLSFFVVVVATADVAVV